MASADGSCTNVMESSPDQRTANPSQTTCINPTQVSEKEVTSKENPITEEIMKSQENNQQSDVTGIIC